ncbi:Mutator mutT protein (7,8-dihydro-8-oxoguanine-triphosphatase) [Indibacter alkaliphilus LW1]|uniref:8-oxo-dGTP diphosphatase n=2 Tax=Indibacter TaxID=647744 RepID=S2DY14_INDAL|nr:Mutator mutT protein (7,8-dihydro-8-oxoguanine-triphosphatase) [Indibacter alkaliphilus LW1]
MHLSSKWEFPGGKLEEPETEEECIKREINEELSLEVQIERSLPNHRYQYPGKREIELVPFVCSYISGELLLQEHQAADWFDFESLKKLDWAEADLPVLEDFCKLYTKA